MIDGVWVVVQFRPRGSNDSGSICGLYDDRQVAIDRLMKLYEDDDPADVSTVESPDGEVVTLSIGQRKYKEEVAQVFFQKINEDTSVDI